MKQEFSIQQNERGQAFVEYALIASLVSLVVAGALLALSPEVRAVASSLITSVSGGVTVENGNLSLPGVSPTLSSGSPTPTASSAPHSPTPSPTPTHSPTPTLSPTPTPSSAPTLSSTSTPWWTPTPTWTPLVILTPTPNAFACTSGSAIVSSESACSTLSSSNYCENYTYNARRRKCSWY